MREIKFRAWDQLTEDWFDECLEIDFEWGGIVNEAIDLTGLADRYIIMQFTGLKDKNGVEIYEGDVIRLIDDVGKEVIVTCEFGTVQREVYGYTVNLCDITGFYFRKGGRATFPIVNNYAGKRDLELFEVIGNIHQHPELLKS